MKTFQKKIKKIKKYQKNTEKKLKTIFQKKKRKNERISKKL